MAERIIIGLGTGRCGTNSLQHMLDRLAETKITHEILPVNEASWIPSPKYFNKICSYFDNLEYEIAGDIAFYYLPYFYLFKERYEHIKFIGLKRDKQAVVESYLKKTATRNHLSFPNNDFEDFRWDIKYPKFYDMPKEKALGSYYDLYYGELFYLQDLFPKQVRVFDIEDLNSIAGVKKIFKFLNLPLDRIEDSFVSVHENSIDVTPIGIIKRGKFKSEIKRLLRRI